MHLLASLSSAYRPEKSLHVPSSTTAGIGKSFSFRSPRAPSLNRLMSDPVSAHTRSRTKNQIRTSPNFLNGSQASFSIGQDKQVYDTEIKTIKNVPENHLTPVPSASIPEPIDMEHALIVKYLALTLHEDSDERALVEKYLALTLHEDSDEHTQSNDQFTRSEDSQLLRRNDSRASTQSATADELHDHVLNILRKFQNDEWLGVSVTSPDWDLWTSSTKFDDYEGQVGEPSISTSNTKQDLEYVRHVLPQWPPAPVPRALSHFGTLPADDLASPTFISPFPSISAVPDGSLSSLLADYPRPESQETATEDDWYDEFNRMYQRQKPARQGEPLR